jgi:hypothetical protein
LSSRAKPRDLQFYGPFLEMFIGWSGEFCEVSSSTPRHQALCHA